MKNRSLIVIGLLATQIAPVQAMENSAVKAFCSAAKSIVALRAIETGIMLGLFGVYHYSSKLYYSYDVGHKIACYSGTLDANAHLIHAVSRQDLEDAELALNRGANPNTGTHDVNPLNCVITYDNEKMVDLLIKKGADVNINGSLGFALQRCATTGIVRKSILKKLIEAGADVDAPYYTGSQDTCIQFARAEAARTRNPDYIEVFNLESKL